MSASEKDKTLSQLVAYAALPDSKLTLDRLKAKSGFVPKFSWHSRPHLVGIEVEVEQVLSNNPVVADFIYSSEGVKIAHFNLWDNKEDGSLRNNGREFVSAPVAGDNVEFALECLSAHLNKAPTAKGHEFTDRTSVHIHLNIRDLTVKQLCNLLLTYIVVEPVLYNFAGGERHRNIFCVPLNQSDLQARLNTVFNHSGEPVFVKPQIQGWRKYLGLNLAPVFGNNGQHVRPFGTVEFRHMPGNMDIKKLLVWIDLLCSIKDYAMSSDFEQNRDMFLELNTTSQYMIILQQIFGSEYARMLSFDNITKRMEDAVLFLKGCFSIGLSRYEDFFHLECVKSLVNTDLSEFLNAASKQKILVRVSKSEETSEPSAKKAAKPKAEPGRDGEVRIGIGGIFDRVAQVLDENDRIAGEIQVEWNLGNAGAGLRPHQEQPVERFDNDPIHGVTPSRDTIRTEVWVVISRKAQTAHGDSITEMRHNNAGIPLPEGWRERRREEYLRGTRNWTISERTFLRTVCNRVRANMGLNRIFV